MTVNCLHGLEISREWIRAGIDRKSFEKYFSFDDLHFIFRLDDRYGIQLEPDQEHLPTPTLQAELATRDIHSSGMQLQFNFISPNSDLEELLQELEHIGG